MYKSDNNITMCTHDLLETAVGWCSWDWFPDNNT